MIISLFPFSLIACTYVLSRRLFFCFFIISFSLFLFDIDFLLIRTSVKSTLNTLLCDLRNSCTKTHALTVLIVTVYQNDWLLCSYSFSFFLILSNFQYFLLTLSHPLPLLCLIDFFFYLGEFGNLLKARKHYTLSLNLQCGRLNLRALYGLIASAKALEELNESDSAKW